MQILWQRHGRRIGAILAVVALVVAAEQLALLVTGTAVGIDFDPLRNAALSLVHGQSVYTDHDFVYPPSAAPLLLPTNLGSDLQAFRLWLVLGMCGLIAASALIATAASRQYRLVTFAVALVALSSGTAAAGSLSLGNLSVLLVPAAVGILYSFERGRWTLGCALLAATLLIKPLLAPLLLVPAIRRQWLALVRTMLPAGVVLGLSMLLVPGGHRFGSVLSYCLSGTNLHGKNAINNLSLRGWVEAHHAPAALGLLASALVGGVVLVRIALLLKADRGSHAPSPLWLGNLVLLGTLLAGHISESHFLLVVIATVLLQAGLDRSRTTLLWFLPGLVILGAPVPYVSLLGIDLLNQSCLVIAELMLLLSCLMSRPVSLRTHRPLILDELTRPELRRRQAVGAGAS